MPLDVSGFTNTPQEFPGIDRAANTIERNKERRYEIDYRHQRDMESDNWRKLNLIQDLTDLSKHQTGSDVANAIGDQKASEILQKYTAASKTLPPEVLLANIRKEMSGTITGMEGVKNELEVSDEQIKQLKVAFPDLNYAQLAKAAREDILHRRFDDNGGFVNPITVPQSKINLADPDELSKYVNGDKNLSDYFQNPKGLDDTHVYEGNANNYTKFTAKIPPWKRANFKPEDLSNGTFLKKGSTPQLVFKSSRLPSDALPSSKDQPFEMMDKDVYDNIGGMTKVELVAKTRKTFPNYDQMNQTEKEYAQRHTALSTAKSLDQTNFHPTEVHTPSASLLKFYAGQSGTDGAVNIHNVYDKIDAALTKQEQDGKAGLTVTYLPTDAKDVISKISKDRGWGLTDSELKIVRGSDGKIELQDADGNVKEYITKEATNLKTSQPGVAEKRQVLKQENQSQQSVHAATRSEWKSAGWTDAQIDEQVRKGKIKVK